jgi:hypothetical protein
LSGRHLHFLPEMLLLVLLLLLLLPPLLPLHL